MSSSMAPAYPSIQAYPQVPVASVYTPVVAEIIYKRRFGYWIWSLAFIASAFFLGAAIGKSTVDRTGYREHFCVFAKILCEFVFGVVSLASCWMLLLNKKFTTEPGHFWNAYFLAVANCFSLAGYIVFYRRIAFEHLMHSWLVLLVVAAGLAGVVTIPEEYEGEFKFLKCLKPWAVDRKITTNCKQ